MTTNVDHQFHKAGFQTDRIFATQGDYGNIQCEKGCHMKVYDAEDLFHQMDQARYDCLNPTRLVPKCPVCVKGDYIMTHGEKRRYLIKELLSELPKYKNMEIPDSAEEQKRLLRSLMNIRAPRPIGMEFLRIQDEYLSEEVRERGITDSDTLPTAPDNNRLVLWRGDITTLKIDAIVNAANSALRGCFVPCHSCVDNIIHSVSGIQLRLACDELMEEQGEEEPTGRAKITPAFNLPCRYVLHTVGPIVSGILTKEHCKQLADCYRSCLKLASDKGLKSLAFCCISTGEFHFPQKEAADIAVRTVTDFLKTDTQIEKVVFNVFKQEDYDIYRAILCV